MSININPIETYVPTIYVNNSEPDLDETNLNHAEQALKRVTDAANAAILALESLDSAKIDAAKIVNNLLATDTSTVLSGPMGKALGDRLTAAENLLTRLNGESFLLKDISSKVITQLKTDLEASFAKAADYSLFSGNSMSGSELGWVAFKHRDYSVGVAFSANISTFPIFIRRNSTGEWSFSGK